MAAGARHIESYAHAYDSFEQMQQILTTSIMLPNELAASKEHQSSETMLVQKRSGKTKKAGGVSLS
mgnify:CR=1 FL=1